MRICLLFVFFTASLTLLSQTKWESDSSQLVAISDQIINSLESGDFSNFSSLSESEIKCEFWVEDIERPIETKLSSKEFFDFYQKENQKWRLERLYSKQLTRIEEVIIDKKEALVKYHVSTMDIIVPGPTGYFVTLYFNKYKSDFLLFEFK